LQLHAFQFVVSEQSSCKYPTKQAQTPVSALQSPELLQSFGHLKSSQCVPWKPSGQSQLHLGFAMPKKDIFLIAGWWLTYPFEKYESQFG
jgi:hypothetical protein